MIAWGRGHPGFGFSTQLPSLLLYVLCRYVRLELLEGVGLFYQGETAAALQKLQSAQAKLQRLSVSDEALAELTDMGFTAAEVTERSPPPPPPPPPLQLCVF